MILTEEQRTLVREKISSLTVEHYQRVERLTKEFEAERKRLDAMLRFGAAPGLAS